MSRCSSGLNLQLRNARTGTSVTITRGPDQSDTRRRLIVLGRLANYTAKPGCSHRRPVLLSTRRPPPGCPRTQQHTALAGRTCATRTASPYGRGVVHALARHWRAG